ncbi:MAG: hypothetical protein FK734_09485 [Asgard group archaeon]|nr:hypothetical protein [Asgard group archaeon]
MTNEQNISITKPAGFRDFFPEDFAKVSFVLNTMRRVSLEFGYVEYEPPSAELLKLYELKSGAGLISETFKITSRSGQKLVLIPELTPTLTRMLAERQQYYTKPIRWFSIPRCYRDETLQRGRVKEFWQYNADILGMEEIYADAEIITILIEVIRQCGLSEKHFVVYINDRSFMQSFMESIGVTDFVDIIRIFDRKDKLLQEKVQKMLKKSFSDNEAETIALSIRQSYTQGEKIFKEIPDTKETRKIIETFEDIRKEAFIEALLKYKITNEQAEILYKLSEIKAQPKEFIKKVTELYAGENADELISNLKELAILLESFGLNKYILFDGSLARGLDYYTGIIFEAWSREGVLPRAIAGGGRYADLVATLGGQPLTGTGFGFGETVLMELMDEFGIEYPQTTNSDVYIAPIKLDDLSIVIDLSNKLRKRGIRAVLNAFDWRIKRHFENAEKQNVQWMLIVGQKDLENNSVTLRDIISGEQELVPIKDIVSVLSKKIKK